MPFLFQYARYYQVSVAVLSLKSRAQPNASFVWYCLNIFNIAYAERLPAVNVSAAGFVIYLALAIYKLKIYKALHTLPDYQITRVFLLYLCHLLMAF